MADLLPCPFCGGEAYVNNTGDKVARNGEWLWTWEVECDEGCVILARAPRGGKFVSEAEAVAAWNRRAPVTTSPVVPEVGSSYE